MSGDTMRTAVLNYLRRSGGATDEEGARDTGIHPNTYRPRRHELEELGLVVDTGERKSTGRGRSAAVYAATDRTMAIADIEIGERVRLSVGDLSGMKKSINELGLLQPIVVTADGRLVSGERRLRACTELGWDEVPVRVAHWLDSAAKLCKAEDHENTHRLDMTVEEKARSGRRIEAAERERARIRMAEGGRKSAPGKPAERSENFTEVSGDTRDIVGEAVGMSGVTYERAKAVVEAADSGDPVAVEALREMNKTGKVTPAYRKVTQQDMTQRQEDVAHAAYRRWRKLIGTLHGITDGLDGFPIDRVLIVATDEEVSEWSDSIAGAMRSLKRARSHMNGGAA